jgi:hypothetical protein
VGLLFSCAITVIGQQIAIEPGTLSSSHGVRIRNFGSWSLIPWSFGGLWSWLKGEYDEAFIFEIRGAKSLNRERGQGAIASHSTFDLRDLLLAGGLRRRPKVKKQLLWNSIFGCEPAPGSEFLRLRLLANFHGIPLDRVVVTPKIVKRPILVAEDFQGQGRLTNVFVVRLYARTRFARLDLHQVGDGSSRSLFRLVGSGCGIRCATSERYHKGTNENCWAKSHF